MMLNKTRTSVSMAFQLLQKIRPHALQDYVARVVSDRLAALWRWGTSQLSISTMCLCAEATVSTAEGGWGPNQSQLLEKLWRHRAAAQTGHVQGCVCPTAVGQHVSLFFFLIFSCVYVLHAHLNLVSIHSSPSKSRLFWTVEGTRPCRWLPTLQARVIQGTLSAATKLKVFFLKGWKSKSWAVCESVQIQSSNCWVQWSCVQC